ncbi:MAG: dTDP-4-dehydrorhamnose reductase [Verrucomicrobiota bacterium]
MFAFATMPARPRILILGAAGGLGKALTRRLAALGEVIAWSRHDLDLSQLEDIPKKLDAQAFDVLLNPAGMTSPDVCEVEPDLAKIVNVDAPAALAASCHRLDRRFIHFSTDYVFDGSKTTPWSEDDPTEPVNHYGRTKRDGEIAVLKANAQALVARVSWLFGPDKASHPDHIITKALQGTALNAIADKTSSPTFTHDLCDWITRLLTHHPEVSGPLHLCHQGTASWQEWGQEALRVAEDMGLPFQTRSIEPLRLADSTFFKAARPPHTTMSTARLTQLTGIQPRAWQEALREYLHGRM